MSWDYFSNRRKAEKEKEMKRNGSTGTNESTRTNDSNGRKGDTVQGTKEERKAKKGGEGTAGKQTTTATGTDNQHTQEETTKKES